MAAFAFLGHQELWYQQYRDVDTGQMLVAVPADPPNVYNVEVTESDLPLPPSDGRWGDPPSRPAPAPVLTPKPAPAPPAPAPEGGVSA